MNEISQNLFSSHHATNPLCAPSTAVDSHLVAFNTRHIQPEGTNYSSVSSMLQCLQRTVLEKHSYFAWQEKPSKTKEGALCDERRVHPKSNKSEQFGKLDMLWWKIVKTQVYFLSGSPHRIVLLCGPEAWLPFKANASEITRTRSRLSRWEPAAERAGRGTLLALSPFRACWQVSALQHRHRFLMQQCSKKGSQMLLQWKYPREMKTVWVSTDRTERARGPARPCGCAPTGTRQSGVVPTLHIATLRIMRF